MTRRDEAMQMLDQLQDALGRLEKSPDRMPTNRALLVIARVVYWLLERWIKEHEGEKNNGK
jgi:hypothetical protein